MAESPSGTSVKGAHPFNSLSEARKFANTSHGYARVLTRGNETIVALDRNVSATAIQQGFTPVTALGSSGGGPPPSAYAAGLGSTAARMAQGGSLYPDNSKSDPHLGTREQFRAKNKAFVKFKKSQGVEINEAEYLKAQDDFYTFKFKQRKANRTG